jgi:probable F420-dependent oxidoreductase
MVSIGVMFANGGRGAAPAHALALATAAEELGCEALWAVQHVVMPVAHASRYPYAADGVLPGGSAVAIPDPLVWLAWVGAVTSRIRLATGVLVLPQQHPLVVAKQVATLDRLTGGRVILGLGAGWLQEEFDALGAEFAPRGAALDEGIEVLRRAWRDDPVEFAGNQIAFEPVHVEPKPAQMVPIHIGGHSDAAARRAGRVADGFFPLGRRGDELRRLVEHARACAVDAGRDPTSVEITVEAPKDTADVALYDELGVHRVLINAPNVDVADVRAGLERRIDALRRLMPSATNSD